MTKLQTLKTARRLLADVGWCQFEIRHRDSEEITAYCAIGALYAATNLEFNKDFRSAQRVLENLLPPNGIFRISSVVMFNDDPDRTKDEILDLFDRAIAVVEKEQTT